MLWIERNRSTLGSTGARDFTPFGRAAVDPTACFAYIGRWFALFVPAALAAANVAAGMRVLDVATGAGGAARQACAVVGSRGTVIGADILVAMLAANRATLPIG